MVYVDLSSGTFTDGSISDIIKAVFLKENVMDL